MIIRDLLVITVVVHAIGLERKDLNLISNDFQISGSYYIIFYGDVESLYPFKCAYRQYLSIWILILWTWWTVKHYLSFGLGVCLLCFYFSITMYHGPFQAQLPRTYTRGFGSGVAHASSYAGWSIALWTTRIFMVFALIFLADLFHYTQTVMVNNAYLAIVSSGINYWIN